MNGAVFNVSDFLFCTYTETKQNTLHPIFLHIFMVSEKMIEMTFFFVSAVVKMLEQYE